MSVYKRPGQADYTYDFWIKGIRFSGRTGATAFRKAKQVEAEKRVEATALVVRERAADAPTVWLLAASRYWDEVGSHHKNAKTTYWALDWLSQHIGDSRPLHEIDDNFVAGLVAKRRGEIKRRGISKGQKIKVSPATVNRTMTEPLRKVLRRAKDVWNVPVANVRWREHMLAEPKERVREASGGEEQAIMGQLERGYDAAVRFAFLNGCRRMEIVGLEWSRVDFFGRQFTVIGKGNKARTIPMSSETRELLWSLRGHHPDRVFTFVAQKTRKQMNQVRGERYPLTDAGLRSAMKRATERSGVEGFRFHDTRHTAATRVLRTSNLKVVQSLLGHEDIATTTKYAHAMSEDIRNALDAATATVSPTEIATKAPESGGKLLKRKGDIE